MGLNKGLKNGNLFNTLYFPGKIRDKIAETDGDKTPLQEKLDEFGEQLSKVYMCSTRKYHKTWNELLYKWKKKQSLLKRFLASKYHLVFNFLMW